MANFLETPEGRRIAYHRRAGQAPGVVFLGGFNSDMTGSKALHLDAWARAQGRAFLRFDYSGHGASDGLFVQGSVGDWAADAEAALTRLTTGPQILVGSSMGGWIALLLARRRPARVAGLVLIAASPEFPERMLAEMDAGQRAGLAASGLTHLPSDYGEPYPITRRLVEEAREHRIFDRPFAAEVPVRLLQGTADTAVDESVALRLLHHIRGPDVRLTLVQGADHRFSTPDCLALIERAVAEVG